VERVAGVASDLAGGLVEQREQQADLAPEVGVDRPGGAVGGVEEARACLGLACLLGSHIPKPHNYRPAEKSG
jgi:hypothetical protein